MLFTVYFSEHFIIMFSESLGDVRQTVRDLYGLDFDQYAIGHSTIEEVTEFIKNGGEIFR